MTEQASYDMIASENLSIDANQYLSVSNINNDKHKPIADNNHDSDDPHNDSNSNLNLRVQDRKDRQGKQIRKGSKLHRITFKDEISLNPKEILKSNELDKIQNSDGEYSGEGSENEEDMRPTIHKKQHRMKRREPLHDVIIVESYKDYNAQNPQWYNNQCCSIL